jgi:hypothetical protein
MSAVLNDTTLAQRSKSALLEIDHCVANVTDLDAAAAFVRSAGFTLSPRSDLTAVGVANHLVLFDPPQPNCAAFFELMTTTQPTKLHPAMAQVLQGQARLSWLVMGSSHAQTSYEHLVQHGSAMPAPVHVKREWRLSQQESIWPEFDVTFPVQHPLPFNLCQYHNVELYHRAEWRQHANGARQLVAALAVAAQPEQLAHELARLWDMPAHALGAGHWRVGGAAVGLELLSPAHYRAMYNAEVPLNADLPAYAGLKLRCKDLAASAAFFDGQGFTRHPSSQSTWFIRLEPHVHCIMEFCA